MVLALRNPALARRDWQGRIDHFERAVDGAEVAERSAPARRDRRLVVVFQFLVHRDLNQKAPLVGGADLDETAVPVGLQGGQQPFVMVGRARLPGLLVSRCDVRHADNSAVVAVGVGDLEIVIDDVEDLFERFLVSAWCSRSGGDQYGVLALVARDAGAQPQWVFGLRAADAACREHHCDPSDVPESSHFGPLCPVPFRENRARYASVAALCQAEGEATGIWSNGAGGKSGKVWRITQVGQDPEPVQRTGMKQSPLRRA